MTNLIDDEFDEFDDENDELLNSDTDQCFFFLCDETLYAIPALSVNEIIEYQTITKVPLLNLSILGITNIRGSIIGVLDLLERFENKKTIIDKKTALVVVNTIYDNTTYNIAILVDEIFEVDGLDKDSITQVPTFGTKIKPAFIKSMARYANQEVYLLDIDTVLDISELSSLSFDDDISNDDTLYLREVKKKKTVVFDEDYEDDDEDEDDISQMITTNSTQTNQYLVFEGPNNQYYAKNVSKIEELAVVKDFDIQKNFDENIIIGTANVRGEMLTLVNFDKWLGLKQIDESSYKELIIVNMGKHKFGLTVRSTEHIVVIDTQYMSKSSDADSKSTFIASIELNGKEVMCTIVDSDKILVDVFQSEKDKSEADIENIDKIDFDKEILFADDSSLIRKSVKQIANQLGVKYDIFENGKLLYETLNKSDIEDIGLIVTDLEMPVMDGRELIIKIRENEKYKNINILVYTNMANNILIQELLVIGATKIIEKLDIKSLSDAIKEFRH
jgi:chemotaxis signal transduction protein